MYVASMHVCGYALVRYAALSLVFTFLHTYMRVLFCDMRVQDVVATATQSR